MMESYSKNITPDSFSGAVFAMEGIDRTTVLINGPTGCKFYHSAISDSQSIHPWEFDPLNYPDKFYFGQPRVPCTYLDSSDYVYGSGEKLKEALSFICGNTDFDLLAVINSPGAALIGDDLKGIVSREIGDKKYVVIETPGFSENICDGYEVAAMETVKKLAFPKRKMKTSKVNILGISIFHKYHRGDVEELKRILSLCGIEINCFLCADCSIKSIKTLSEAELNIVIHPEYGCQTAQFLEKMYATPYYVCDSPPIGFSATEKFIRDICGILKKDYGPFMEESEKSRAEAYMHISRINSLTGLPKGVNFAVEGTWSEVYSYTSFLVRYFGMIAESASVVNRERDVFRDRTERLFLDLNLSNALKKDIMETTSELVFANGNTIAGLRLQGRRFSGIETSLPSLGYIDVILKTHLGLRGALLITEQVLNGLMFE